MIRSHTVRPRHVRFLAPIATTVLAGAGALGVFSLPAGASSGSCTAPVVTTSPAIAGSIATPVGTAGTVTVAFDGTALAVTDVIANPGWTTTTGHATGPEVEVTFTDTTGARAKFASELERGTITTETTTCAAPAPAPTPPTGPATYPVGTAGTVTVTFDGTALAVTDVIANPGWTPTTGQATGPEVRVTFTDTTGARWKFEAELEHGTITTQTEQSAVPVPPTTPPTTAPARPATRVPTPKVTTKPVGTTAPKVTPKPTPKPTPKGRV